MQKDSKTIDEVIHGINRISSVEMSRVILFEMTAGIEVLITFIRITMVKERGIGKQVAQIFRKKTEFVSFVTYRDI
jgi:hypothetical protein